MHAGPARVPRACGAGARSTHPDATPDSRPADAHPDAAARYADSGRNAEPHENEDTDMDHVDSAGRDHTITCGDPACTADPCPYAGTDGRHQSNSSHAGRPRLQAGLHMQPDELAGPGKPVVLEDPGRLDARPRAESAAGDDGERGAAAMTIIDSLRHASAAELRERGNG